MRTPTEVVDGIAFSESGVLALGADSALALAQELDIRVQDRKGEDVYPGFVDAHMHFLHLGVLRIRPDLHAAKSRAEALKIISTHIAAHDEPFHIAEGWDEANWADRAPLTSAELENICSDRPLVARRVCGHISVANRAGAELVAKLYPEQVENGVLVEEPSIFLNSILPLSPDQWDRALAVATEIAYAEGVTTIGEYCQWPAFEAYQRAAAAGTLGIKIHASLYIHDLQVAKENKLWTGKRDGRLQVAGFKIFLDGSLGGHTAWLSKPYCDCRETKGRPNFKPKEIIEMFRGAQEAGFQIHAHAIGDAAITAALDAYQKLDPLPELRHRIEHYELPSNADVTRTKKLGITPCSQPNFVGEWSAKGGMYETRLGEDYKLNNRFATYLSRGVDVCFGSDGMPFGPKFGVDSAVRHPVEEERLDEDAAIWLYTNRAAHSIHSQVGVLKLGSPADIRVGPGATTKETWIDGCRVWKSS